MITARLILLILAVIAFALAVFDVKSRVNLTAAGLFFWALSLVLP
jgi:hypothetical protein